MNPCMNVKKSKKLVQIISYKRAWSAQAKMGRKGGFLEADEKSERSKIPSRKDSQLIC